MNCTQRVACRGISRRRGFTLVEMLAVASILAILAGLMFGGLSAAWNSAKDTKTRATIAKLHRLIMAKYDSFRTLRPPIDFGAWPTNTSQGNVKFGMPNYIANQTKYYDDPATPQKPQLFDTSSSTKECILTPNWGPNNKYYPTWEYEPFVAQARMNAMRDWIRMTLPDRWSDVFNETANGSLVPTTLAAVNRITPSTAMMNVPLIRFRDNTAALLPPAETAYFEQMYITAFKNVRNSGVAANDDAAAKLLAHYGNAKLLYLIVSTMPEALRDFTAEEVADLDNDGLKVFIDGWRKPIYFLRWPAGYLPPDQVRRPSEYATKSYAQTTLQTGDPNNDHDPFDPQRVDANAYSVYPLIYSGGLDGEPDINLGTANDGSTYVYALDNSGNLSTTVLLSKSTIMVGHPANPTDQNNPFVNLRHQDNITNHDTQIR